MPDHQIDSSFDADEPDEENLYPLDSWQHAYAAPSKMGWLLLSPAGRILTRIILAVIVLTILIAMGLEIFSTINPTAQVAWLGLVLAGTFILMWLSFATALILARIRLTAYLNIPYWQAGHSYRTFGLTGPPMPVWLRITQFGLFVLDFLLLLFTVHLPLYQYQESTCPTAGGICSNEAGGFLPIIAAVLLFTSMAFFIISGIIYEQHRASREAIAAVDLDHSKGG